MTADQAIELLKIKVLDWSTSNDKDYYKALDLSIEALKREQNHLQLIGPQWEGLLPGETKE